MGIAKDILTSVGSTVALAVLGWLWVAFSKRGQSWWNNLGKVTIPIRGPLEGASSQEVEIAGLRLVAIVSILALVLGLVALIACPSLRRVRPQKMLAIFPRKQL